MADGNAGSGRSAVAGMWSPESAVHGHQLGKEENTAEMQRMAKSETQKVKNY